MTTNRFHPFKDHIEYTEAALDGRLILWQAGGHEGVVLPRMPTTAPVVVTKDLVDDVIEAHEQKVRDERIAQLEVEIVEDMEDIAELTHNVSWWLGAFETLCALRVLP